MMSWCQSKLFNGFLFFLKTSIILLFILWAVAYSMSMAINMPTLHLDGAFQTASGLFRLSFGQLPGRDFFPYLGIGPLFALYPAFKAFGSDLSASVFSAQFMTLVLGGLSVSIVLHLFFFPKSFITSLAVGVLFFSVSIVAVNCFSFPLHYSIVSMGHPGNSLRPIRSVAPYLVVIIYYLLILNIKSDQLKIALSGLLSGTILLWSNDFAIPTVGLFLVLIAFSCLAGSSIKVKSALLYLFFMFFSWVVLLELATLGYPLGFLKYNFLDVAKDQWWFFGPYGELSRVFSLQQASRLISQENIFPLITLALTVVAAIKTKRIEHVLVAWIGVVLFAGGVLASVGGHIGGYFDGFYFWGVVTFVFALLRVIFVGVRKFVELDSYSLFRIELAAVFALFLVSFVVAMHAWQKYKYNLASAESDPDRFYVPELGGYLGLQWKDYINLVRQAGDQYVLEEYWGVWSATQKIAPAWPIDSVIHALGKTREVATNNFENTDIFITTRNSTSPEWQPWSLSQNFWLYDELLKNWTPNELSPSTVVWRKNQNIRLYKSIKCYLGNETKSINLEVSESGFYRVEVDYEFSGKGRHLLLVKNNLSYGADAGGYVSIDPNGKKAIFPAYISQSGVISLDFKVIGGEEYDLNVVSCISNKISFSDAEVLNEPGMPNEHFFLTDDNWKRGIARNWAGFFVPNTADFVSKYQVGLYVDFGSIGSRKIIRIEPAGRYLNIYLEGDPLDVDEVGLPSRFTVVHISSIKGK